VSELQISKESAHVRLITVSGNALSGEIFLSSYHPLRQAREEPEDVLNSPEAYFPLLTSDGVVVVSKSAVAELEYDQKGLAQDDGTTTLGVSVTLSVTMQSGNLFNGELWVEGPVNTPRLLDFMNRHSESGAQFIPLHEEGRVRLLNRSHIETIRPLD
jgi:hypothetical protein